MSTPRKKVLLLDEQERKELMIIYSDDLAAGYWAGSLVKLAGAGRNREA
ncbi:MAG TPA: hypothetical protein VKE51_13010 [Vicinamibacterales bacterium]|nr:hypothetical protein [Vicinamibacterales bacterium]